MTPISPPVPQRWERPFDFPPGHWKKQLPGKLLKIAARGDIEALQQLLIEHPEYLNKHGPHNRTLLWEAVRKGRLATVQWLIEQGAELDTPGCYNSESHVQITPYCAAIYYDRPAIADYLRTFNPQLDIFQAAFLGDQPRVANALKADSTLLNAHDPHDEIYFIPLLSFAVAGGQTAMVDFLLENGAIVEPYSAQLVYLAARDARLDLVETLIAHGADPRAVDGGTFVTIPDLHIIEYLLERGTSATRLGKNGFPPLVYIARGDKAESPAKVQLLLDHGADVNAAGGPHNRTALHCAAIAGHLQVMQLLLANGANPKLKDADGATPLQLAQAAGKSAAVALLIEAV